MFRDSSIGATKVYYVVKKIIRINSTKDEVRTIERLSNNDGDGYENVTKKLNLRHFKLYRAYSTSSVRKMLVNFSGVEF